MKNLRHLLESRFWALMRKEIQQIFRSKQLIFLLIFPPTIQLLIFGSALSPDVDRLHLVSSVTLIREKDVGTLEQLLMTPAAEWEILLAKIVPLFILLMGDVLLASGISRLVFNLPFRGNFGLFLLLSGLYMFVCIGLGILLATLSRTQQQAILTSFFFNVPIIQLSGAIAPIESIPSVFRFLSFFDPLRHYVVINRNLLLKGVGWGEIWQDAIALVIFAIILLTISIKRFRSQLN